MELFKSKNIKDLYSNTTLSLLTFLVMGNYSRYYTYSTILPFWISIDGQPFALAYHRRFTISKTLDINDLLLLSKTKDE